MTVIPQIHMNNEKDGISINTLRAVNLESFKKKRIVKKVSLEVKSASLVYLAQMELEDHMFLYDSWNNSPK